jgi:putative ABC transport system permease protein
MSPAATAFRFRQTADRLQLLIARMDLFTITVREVQRRPGRAILTILSIVIGVAAVVAVNLAVGESRRSYAEMFQTLAGRTALEVVAEGGGKLQESLVSQVAQVPGVRAAAPTLQNYTVVRREGKRYELLAMGVSPKADAQVRDYRLTEGRLFQNWDEVLLDSGFAAAANLHINDELPFMTRRGMQKLTVVGLLASHGLAGFREAGTVFLPLKSAQWMFRRPGQIDTISVVLEDKVEPAQAAHEIAARLPEGVKVGEPADRARLGRDVFINAEQGLRFAGALTMTLAVFIIFNTFMMNVSERKRQLAILRTIGATRGQIMRMLLCEAFLMGVVGTIAGIPIGLLGAKFLLAGLSLLRGWPAPQLQWTVEPLLLAAGIGPGMALLGAYFPARLAGRVSPLEGLRSPVLFDSRRVSKWMTLTGVALFAVSGLLVAGCIKGWLPSGVSVPAGVVFLASFALVIPILLRPVGRGVAALLSPWLGVEAELAEIQITRRSARCGLTAGVLYIAVATGVGLGTTILNNVQDVRNWYRKTVVGDFFVRAMFPDPATGAALPLPDSYADDLRKIEGVTGLDAVRFTSTEVGKLPVTVIACQFTDPDHLPLDLVEGKEAEVRRGLSDGKVVVGSVLAQRLGISQGSQIEAQTADGLKPLVVVGISTDYTVGGLVLYIERAAAARIFQVDGSDVFAIRAATASRQSVYQRLQEYCDEHGLLLHSFNDLVGIIDRIMSGVLHGLWGLLGLGFAVAGFGIANTLTMNVLEQTREIGLLRAIAMTRPQVRKMVLAQAAMIAIIGLAVGILAGINTAYIIGLCMVPLIGYTVPFTMHPMLLLGMIPIVLVIVLFSAWVPMQRAAALNTLVAISYE